MSSSTMWGDARALEEVCDVCHGGGAGLVARTNVDVARAAVAQVVLEVGGVKALRHGGHDALPAKAGGAALLARDAVEQGNDARLRSHEWGSEVERRVEAAGLYGKEQQLSGLGILGAHRGQVAGLAEHADLFALVAGKASVVHYVLDGVVTQRSCGDAAIEQANGPTADDGHPVDGHGVPPNEAILPRASVARARGGVALRGGRRDNRPVPLSWPLHVRDDRPEDPGEKAHRDEALHERHERAAVDRVAQGVIDGYREQQQRRQPRAR